jgi:hypothetical protein
MYLYLCITLLSTTSTVDRRRVEVASAPERVDLPSIRVSRRPFMYCSTGTAKE